MNVAACYESLADMHPPKTDKFVCGLVASCSQQPKQTRTGEFMISVAIADEADWHRRNDTGTQLLVVNIFRQSSSQLPSAIPESTIICFPRLKLQMFGRLQGVCYKQEWFALFHPSVAQYDDGVDYHLRPYWCSKLLPEGSDHQFPVERIHQLQCWFRDNSRQSVPPVVIVGDDDDLMIIDNATGSALLRAGGTTVLDNGAPGRSLSSRRPLYKAEDIRGPNEFFDFIGEVLYVAMPDDMKSIVTVTDYTVLKGLNGCPDRQGFRCTLWDNHARDCQELQPGMFVRIDNLRMKLDANGNMEAVLNGGGTRKLFVLSADSGKVRELIDRRGKQAWADVLQNSQFDFPPDGEPFISENYMLAIDDDDDRLTDSVADNLKNGTDVVISLLEASQVDDTPMKFKCRVRFNDYFPKNSSVYRTFCTECKQICSDNCPCCQGCQSADNCTLVSLVGLLANDNSHSLPLLKFSTIQSKDSNRLLDGPDFEQEFLAIRDALFEVTIVSFPVFCDEDGRRIIMYRLMDTTPL